MFVGRQNELDTLERLYQTDKFQMVVLYGRRRIGKTTLINHFIKSKPAIFFTAQEANDHYNLAELSRRIYRFFDLPSTTGSFTNWNDALSFLAEKAKSRRFILAFDEFPYAAGSNHSLPSILQQAIDHELRETGLFLILSGSHVGFMEDEVLGYKSPLFGRRTAQMRLEAFDYLDAARMLPEFSDLEKILLYSCLGGTPYYLSQVDPSQSFQENITRLYFDISGYLYSEPAMLLQQELREPSLYNSLITAIAKGASRLNEISTAVGENPTKINKYLMTLINLQILKKEYPFGEDPAKSRHGIYKIADNCYLFWYRFVFPNRPEIESGNGSIISAYELNAESFSAFVGKPPFEDICLQYMIRMNRNNLLPFRATSHGSWWGTDPQSRQQSDIDLVLADRRTGSIILGECKWRNDVDQASEIKKLISKIHLLPQYKNPYYYFFSKNDLADSANNLSDNRLHLVSLRQLFDVE